MLIVTDTETTGRNPYLGDRAFLITWCGLNSQPSFTRVGIDPMEDWMAKTADATNEICGHNLVFDMGFMEKLGFVFAGTLHDTLIAAHIFNPLEPSKSLKDLAKKYLGRENQEEQKLIAWFMSHGMKANNKREYIKVPEDLIIPYALADVEMTAGLWQFYKSRGIIDSPVYRFECDKIHNCKSIMQEGMKIDKEYTRKTAIEVTEKILEVSAKAKELFGIDNLGSDKEIANFLFNVCKFECKKKTTLGNPCFDDVALRLYDHPVVPYIKEYRNLTVCNSTFLQPMLNKTDQEDRLHASLNQTGARTGRFSSSNPNIENIPNSNSDINIRRGFIPRSDRFVLLTIDISQIELRVLTHFTGEPAMLQALRTRKGDLHAETARHVLGGVTSTSRFVAKKVNFGIVYGAGYKKIYETILKDIPDIDITLEQVRSFHANYFETFTRVRDFIWKVQDMVRRSAVKDPENVGRVKAKISGRYYHCPADKAYRITNYLVQGESAMFFKSRLPIIDALLQGKETKLINVVHDEFVFDLCRDEWGLIRDLTSGIEDTTTFTVPIFANAFICEKDWSHKTSVSSGQE